MFIGCQGSTREYIHLRIRSWTKSTRADLTSCFPLLEQVTEGKGRSGASGEMVSCRPYVVSDQSDREQLAEDSK